jgi:predicted CXXCH cytochrome family protein
VTQHNVSRIAVAGVIASIGAALAGFLISCATNDVVIAPPPMIAGARFTGPETCAACHKEAQPFKLTLHARMQIPGEGERIAVQGCESCHGPGSKHVDAGGGRGKFIINPGKNPEACFQCHLDKKAETRLEYHHPIAEARVSCVSCHDPHGLDIYKPPGMLVARANDVCAQCHREQARPFVYEHEAMREGCVICHDVHGSINPKLLAERDNNLCLKCHAQVPSAPGTIFIGEINHTTFLQQGTCFSAGCHSAVHGSNLSRQLRY